MMGVVGCLTYEFQVSLPVMASRGLHAGATGFGFMTAAMGVGAVCGGLVVAARGQDRPAAAGARRQRLRRGDGAGHARPQPRASSWSRWRSPAPPASRSCRPATRRCSSAAEPEMRGRVMSLWFVAFQGSTPIGGPDRRLGDGRRRGAGRPRARRGHLHPGRRGGLALAAPVLRGAGAASAAPKSAPLGIVGAGRGHQLSHRVEVAGALEMQDVTPGKPSQRRPVPVLPQLTLCAGGVSRSPSPATTISRSRGSAGA